MTVKNVGTPAPKSVIAKSTWPKKELADAHLEAMLFCGFGCIYCSSNKGARLRFLKRLIREQISKLLGKPFKPMDGTDVGVFYENIAQHLETELRGLKRRPGLGQTLVYSQLTDGFSPVLLRRGTPRRILELLLEHTDYRIRILTKNAIVGNKTWRSFFKQHAERFVVGLSIGSLDKKFTSRMEKHTSAPLARVAALSKLQEAGISTYGMLCPVFPQVVFTDQLEQLVDSINAQQCEKVWFEPFNARGNWRQVREVYGEKTEMWDWFTDVHENRNTRKWSDYAATLYQRVYAKAAEEGWQGKLRYLLYESAIDPDHVSHFGNLDGVLLQSPSDEQGFSKHAGFAELQQRLCQTATEQPAVVL